MDDIAELLELMNEIDRNSSIHFCRANPKDCPRCTPAGPS